MVRVEVPEVRYADADGVAIAYWVQGDGPVDLVRVPGLMSGILASNVDPVVSAHCAQLAGCSRLVVLDRRGQGLSDPSVSGGAPLFEQQVQDVGAVMDAIGSDRAALLGASDAGPVAILFAAMYPDRVSSLILNGAWVHRERTPEFPYGLDPATIQEFRAAIRSGWGDIDEPWALEFVAPSRARDPGFRRTLAQVQQLSASPSVATTLASILDFDARAVLPLVQAPTLVVAAEGHPAVLRQAEVLVEQIPDARLALVPGADAYPGEHTPEISALIEEFLTGTPPPVRADRVLATVLFTDIVGSTEQLTRVGDQRWRVQLDHHDAAIREQLSRFRGREINTAGDGFFATFDGPARAIACARAIIDVTQRLGIDVRAGVHAGECEVRGDDLGGIAVHIGARVCSAASARQVLVTSTVKDLVTGSGVAFSDHGLRELKGIPDRWHLYEVVS